MGREDAADGDVLKEARLDELIREKEAQARARRRLIAKRKELTASSGVLKFEATSAATDTFVTRPKTTHMKDVQEENSDEELDEDFIDMSALEELMDDLSMEEEIDDEISLS